MTKKQSDFIYRILEEILDADYKEINKQHNKMQSLSVIQASQWIQDNIVKYNSKRYVKRLANRKYSWERQSDVSDFDGAVYGYDVYGME